MNCHYWLRNNREERSSHLLRARKPEITRIAGLVLSELPDSDRLPWPYRLRLWRGADILNL